MSVATITYANTVCLCALLSSVQPLISRIKGGGHPLRSSSYGSLEHVFTFNQSNGADSSSVSR